VTAIVVGNGFIGSAAARALAETGRSVTVLGRRDGDLLVDLVRTGSEVVFAAGPSVPVSVEADPSLGHEALRLLRAVLDVVCAAPATLLLVSSGGAVYGEPDRLPIDESHPLRPVSEYGRLAVATEALVATAVQRHGIAATALRCGNVYGPGQDATRRQGLVAVLLDAAATGRPVDVWGDGSVARDYVHVDDVAAVVAACAGRPDLPIALNVGTGKATTVTRLLLLVEEVTGVSLDVRHRPGRLLDVSRGALDIGRLCGLLPFEPVPLELGVARTWAEVTPRSLV
jgi:UDP-glucose 4-epimerase